MIWIKKQKIVKVKETPKIGDFKRRVRFAFFPVKIEDKILWLEKYVKVWEFKEMSGLEEVEVTSGGFEDLFTSIGALNTRTTLKPYSFRSWCYYGREFIEN